MLAGLGVRGTQWRDAILNNLHATLVGAVEVQADPADETEIPIYDTIEEALTLQPDAVLIATPPETHLELVNASLRAGIPVLCEKPLSESLDEARSMALTAKEMSTPLLLGMNFRYVPSAEAKKRIIEKSELGQPIFGEFTYIRNRDGTRADLNSYPLTMADPMLVEQSIHHLDLMRHVYGREVVAASARMWNPPTSVYRGNSCVSAILTFEGDLIVNYFGTWTSGSSGFDFRWRTDLELGVAIQPDQFGDLLVSRLDEDRPATGPLYDPVGEPLEGLNVGPTVPFEVDTAALLQHFLNVLDGSEAPGPTASDHLLTLNLLEAIKEASESGDTVDVLARARLAGVY